LLLLFHGSGHGFALRQQARLDTSCRLAGEAAAAFIVIIDCLPLLTREDLVAILVEPWET